MSNIPAAGALRPQAKAKLLAFGLFLAARGVLGGNESCVAGLGNASMEVGDDPALLQSRVKVRATAEHDAPLALLADADKEDSASNNKAEATTAAERNAWRWRHGRARHGTPRHGTSRPNIASRENFRDVICPFLSTLINEGVLAVKDEYTEEELAAIIMQAGADATSTEADLEANFVDIPSGIIDLFNMEGNPNEHFTSTGANDCATFFFDCFTEGGPGTRACNTKTKRCKLPNSKRFSEFVTFVDFDPVDMRISNSELQTNGVIADFIDSNVFGEGNIQDSHGLFIAVFGTNDSISIDDLRRLSLDRKFPNDYVFPR
jgi:hypothetical protein